MAEPARRGEHSTEPQTREVMARELVAGISGLVDGEGQAVAFSPEVARELLLLGRVFAPDGAAAGGDEFPALGGPEHN